MEEEEKKVKVKMETKKKKKNIVGLEERILNEMYITIRSIF